MVKPDTLKCATVLSSLSIDADPVNVTFPVRLGVSTVEIKYTLKLSWLTETVPLPFIIKFIAVIDAYPIPRVSTATNTNLSGYTKIAVFEAGGNGADENDMVWKFTKANANAATMVTNGWEFSVDKNEDGIFDIFDVEYKDKERLIFEGK